MKKRTRQPVAKLFMWVLDAPILSFSSCGPVISQYIFFIIYVKLLATN